MKRTECEQSQQQAEEHIEDLAAMSEKPTAGRRAKPTAGKKCKANSRLEEHSQRQAREEHSQQQAMRTKGLRPRQGEVRGETHHRGKLQPASSRSIQEPMQMCSRGNMS